MRSPSYNYYACASPRPDRDYTSRPNGAPFHVVVYIHSVYKSLPADNTKNGYEY